MQIFSAEEMQQLDQLTIEKESIPSIDLMERAAKAFLDAFLAYVPHPATVRIFAGQGNNGGDGLALGRLLLKRGYPVDIFVVRQSAKKSADFILNEER